LDVKNTLDSYDFTDVSGKAQCWQKFQIVLKKGSTERIFSKTKPDHCFVKCKTCDDIYIYCSDQASTSLNRHKCKNVEECVEEVKVASVDQKLRINKKLMIMCVKDGRPFEISKSAGFIDFVQEVIDVSRGLDYRLDAKTLLWHPTTISRNVHNLKMECADELKMRLIKQESDNVGIAFSTDIWTDSTNKVFFTM
jgi:hypothetical protein